MQKNAMEICKRKQNVCRATLRSLSGGTSAFLGLKFFNQGLGVPPKSWKTIDNTVKEKTKNIWKSICLSWFYADYKYS